MSTAEQSRREQNMNAVGHAMLLVVNLLGSALLVFMLIVLLPKAAGVFQDFGAELSPPTVAVLDIARYPAISVGFAALILIAQIAAFMYGGSARVTLLMCLAMMVVLIVLAIGLTVLMPYVEMTSTVTRGP